ncbi:hypothetical protein [Enterobacter hormaechei]|uniref:hypothetical protein n=1 Tax=Enterobacter hormaechei TaxID=158836 RepID=UPI0010FA70A0|nr:hypothetical protein [Enterobacter hormaechei]QXA78837.1 hypothetical protein I6L64_00575 [Enterobacter hormaechei]
MDEKVMALSALDAAQKSAEWAYWSMLGTWVSAAATLIAALVALWAIKGWRQHEEALELREFRITAYNFHLTLIRAPKYNAEDLDERDFIAVQATFNAMNDIYLSTIKMHDAVKRGHASEVYQKIADVHTKYIKGEIDKDEADNAVLKIRQHEPMLGIGLKEE